ncbi:SAM-dependent methyltransferase [Bacillus sp. AFS002410]|uniref:methyltransferase n=1 Tax=Bacillus sp. AFS002410 TaxID=2033481 RepID=UPI000BF20305|nr:methyltransferase [Bacillus sp. AFS002410]PEJ57701.1 SAM-dependent methyltransferase [Bacillus sp. AFS002410]
MIDKYYDDLLNIKTEGEQKGFNASFHYHRYEATPYSALEQLFQQYLISCDDRVVDFGCGKGRLNFYLNNKFDATVVGIEMNEKYYSEAVENKENYLKKKRISEDKILFYCCLAEDYSIAPSDNRFYFFNPFSIQIFRSIINNILISVEQSKREIEIILYYSSDDYIYFLENQTAFELKQEIILPDIYKQNPYERFLIYRLDY